MNHRLSTTARKAAKMQIEEEVFLDCYNNAVHTDIAPTVTTRIYDSNHYWIMEQEQQDLGWSRNAKGEVVDRHPVDVANCVTASKRDNTQNYVKEESSVLTQRRTAEGRELRKQGVDTFANKELMPRENGLCGTLTSVAKDNLLQTRTRIRKLTERELFRLMDVDEPDIETLLSAGIPKTQLAKMAGNSIVVGVLYHIFNRLLIDTEAEANTQLKLF